MDDDTNGHLYGTPDPDNRQSPPANGSRGEAGATVDPAPGESRTIAPEGRAITVEETDGRAAAEAGGRIGTAGEEAKTGEPRGSG